MMATKLITNQHMCRYHVRLACQPCFYLQVFQGLWRCRRDCDIHWPIHYRYSSLMPTAIYYLRRTHYRRTRRHHLEKEVCSRRRFYILPQRLFPDVYYQIRNVHRRPHYLGPRDRISSMTIPIIWTEIVKPHWKRPIVSIEYSYPVVGYILSY